MFYITWFYFWRRADLLAVLHCSSFMDLTLWYVKEFWGALPKHDVSHLGLQYMRSHSSHSFWPPLGVILLKVFLPHWPSLTNLPPMIVNKMWLLYVVLGFSVCKGWTFDGWTFDQGHKSDMAHSNRPNFLFCLLPNQSLFPFPFQGLI